MANTIITDFTGDNAAHIRFIRETVFINEQNVNPDADFDGLDEEAVHVLVREDSGKYVGTGRMLNDGHIGRIAVLKEYRGSGFGAVIVTALVREAEKRGMNRVYLGAQIHARGFYEKLGFTAYGDIFVDENIDHIHMEKLL